MNSETNEPEVVEGTVQSVKVTPIATPPQVPAAVAPKKDLGPIPSELAQATFTDIYRLACQLAKSTLLPVHLRNRPDDVAVTLLTGKDLGVSAMMAIRGIVIVEGKPTFDAGFMRALVKSRDRTARIEILESTAERARVRCTRGDEIPFEAEFSMEEARRITYGRDGKKLAEKDNYRNYPKDMCFARATARGCRAIWSDILFGCYLAEELEELVDTSQPPPPSPVGGPKRRGSGHARTIEETMVDPQRDEPFQQDSVIDTNAASGAAAVAEPDVEAGALPSEDSAPAKGQEAGSPAAAPTAVLEEPKAPAFSPEESAKRARLLGAILDHSNALEPNQVEAAYARANLSFDMIDDLRLLGTAQLAALVTALGQARIGSHGSPSPSGTAAPGVDPSSDPVTMRLSSARRDPKWSEKLRIEAEREGLSMRHAIGLWPASARRKVFERLVEQGMAAS